ncbi:autoinducer binding domain-containing protein [Paraburkholderia humisilvae]|uniref:Transcriptional activator protein AnoR n=1 Tax=Paraburkholderia humisilvae TaxID=627669 RepID=A0A6J5FBV3_9BURK|nr:autoinducer binding domain-containing protein [Paraburkholderia humisilvae]CAB3775202.1 Transcriptional activator protein AnoR [Paraburkholderia humisilvae]
MHELLWVWLNEVSASESNEAVLAALARVARDLGFDHAAYGMRRPVPITKPQIIMVSTYPEEWQARYIKERYVEIDPTVKGAICVDTPLTWSSNAGDSVGQFWEEAMSVGILHGWSAVSRGADGTVGLLTLSRKSGRIGAAECASNEKTMVLLAQAAHAVMVSRLPTGRVAEGHLSLREIDVLKWTADGKTAYEIARILNISESTVNFHIKNIVSKLACSNKIQAAAKAALTGLLR